MLLRRVLSTAALAAACLLAACGGSDDTKPTGPLPSVATGQVEVVPVTSANHIQGPISYSRVPPPGGNHAPTWQNCGYYDTPVSAEQAVHSLEHGAVWIAYHPNLAPADVRTLAQLARNQTFILVSPFPNLEAPIIATAWGRQQRIASAKDPALNAFVSQFRLGPQNPEPGAPCTGGVGTPK